MHVRVICLLRVIFNGRFKCKFAVIHESFIGYLCILVDIIKCKWTYRQTYTLVSHFSVSENIKSNANCTITISLNVLDTCTELLLIFLDCKKQL